MSEANAACEGKGSPDCASCRGHLREIEALKRELQECRDAESKPPQKKAAPKPPQKKAARKRGPPSAAGGAAPRGSPRGPARLPVRAVRRQPPSSAPITLSKGFVAAVYTNTLAGLIWWAPLAHAHAHARTHTHTHTYTHYMPIGAAPGHHGGAPRATLRGAGAGGRAGHARHLAHRWREEPDHCARGVAAGRRGHRRRPPEGHRADAQGDVRAGCRATSCLARPRPSPPSPPIATPPSLPSRRLPPIATR
jgi:hypothetical protein